MKKVLITGGGGFIGSHCIDYWLNNTDWKIFCIDSFKHKGQYSRLDNISTFFLDRLKIFHHDLYCPIDRQLENLLLERKFIDGQIKQSNFDYIIDMASNSAVERSTADPTECLLNNFNVTLNTLEFARKNPPKKYVHISTDEVFGECDSNTGHEEWATLKPSNPYAASKAAQDMICMSYWRTYNLPIFITHCANVIGEMQDYEKFLPKLIQCLYLNKEVPIHGDEKTGSRTYLYTANKAHALKFLLERPVTLYNNNNVIDKYNICGSIEITNYDFAKLVSKIMNKPLKYKFVPCESARAGYDKRYMLNGNKLHSLGWSAPYSFEESVKRIVDWTIINEQWIL